MAITDAYATESDFTGRVGANTITVGLQSDLEAMSRVLERRLGQFFNRDAAAVARVYVPRRTTDCLYLNRDADNPLVPGIATSAGVSIKADLDDDESFAGETAWASTDYELQPLNALQGPEVRPYTAIRVKPSTAGGAQKNFAAGRRYEITAVFGWPAVPETIKNLTIEAVRLWRIEGPRGTNLFSDMDQVFSVSREARSLLAEAMDVYSPGPVFA